jgi:mannose-6-phosphate isomerase-like protein (cupin superfamily)
MKVFEPEDFNGTKEYGGIVKFILSKENCPDLSAGFTILEPGEILTSEEIHEIQDEVFYIVRGTLTIFSSGKEYLTAKQGQIVLIPKKFPHHSKNLGDVQLVFLWFAANK